MVPCFPLLGLTPSGLFMGLSSTIIYTSELILFPLFMGLIVAPGKFDVLKREPPLIQQVNFELFEVITKTQILLNKVKITFN